MLSTNTHTSLYILTVIIAVLLWFTGFMSGTLSKRNDITVYKATCDPLMSQDQHHKWLECDKQFLNSDGNFVKEY